MSNHRSSQLVVARIRISASYAIVKQCLWESHSLVQFRQRLSGSLVHNFVVVYEDQVHLMPRVALHLCVTLLMSRRHGAIGDNVVRRRFFLVSDWNDTLVPSPYSSLA